MMKTVKFLLTLLVCACAQTFVAAQSESVPTRQPSSEMASVAPVYLKTPAAAASSTLPLEVVGELVNQAKQLLKSHGNADGKSNFVTLAALDRETSRIQLLTLDKELFLTRDAELSATTSQGQTARVKIARANGVNTAVTIQDVATGRQLVPLVVEYPIAKNGGYLAYYTSAHPALLSPEVVSDGALYIRAKLDAAAAQLAAQGIQISPEIVDIAEHLCIVEHTDHQRFLTEERGALFNEILSLYALNQPDTYRYSVSVAGAGGMVQMIPQTYAAIRAQHPSVNLKADFVSGMTDHDNALKAMLLYMQDTWNNLQRDTDVQDALRQGLATQAELVAAGYNSNPMRLPLYLRRGGAGWRALIPAETQMYLQIYHSLDQLVSLPAGSGRSTDPNGTQRLNATAAAPLRHVSLTGIISPVIHLLPALGDQLLLRGSLLPLGLL